MINTIKRGAVIPKDEREKILLSLLYKKINALGRTPTIREWNDDKELPSSMPIQTCFGGWKKFLKHANVQPATQLKYEAKVMNTIPKGVDIIRISELETGDVFLYHQNWRKVIEKDEQNIYYQTLRKKGSTKEIVGKRSKQYVQVERAVKTDASPS